MPIAPSWNSAPTTNGARAPRRSVRRAPRPRLRVAAESDEREELVAALAGEHVALADDGLDPLGGLAQQLVAGGVAERVVDA